MAKKVNRHDIGTSRTKSTARSTDPDSAVIKQSLALDAGSEYRLRMLIQQEVYAAVADIMALDTRQISKLVANKIAHISFMLWGEQAQILEKIGIWLSALDESDFKAYIQSLIDKLEKWIEKGENEVGNANLNIIALRVALRILRQILASPDLGEPGSKERKEAVDSVLEALGKIGMLKDIAALEFMLKNVPLCRLPTGLLGLILRLLKGIFSGSSAKRKIERIKEILEKEEPTQEEVEEAQQLLEELENSGNN